MLFLISANVITSHITEQHKATQRSESISASNSVANSKMSSTSAKLESNLEEAETEVDNLFTDNSHKELEADIKDIGNAQYTVSQLPRSTEKSNLKRLISKANKLKENEESAVTDSSTKDSSTESSISGNAKQAIKAVSEDAPELEDNIGSINTDSTLGTVITTQDFKLKKRSDSQELAGKMEKLMKVIRSSLPSSGIGIVQKESGSDTLFAVYFKATNIEGNLDASSSDFFNNSTSFYVDGSVAGSNESFSDIETSKEYPTVDGKTYTNMLKFGK